MIQALETAWQHLNDPARFGGVIEQSPATAAALGLLLVLALLATGGRSHALRFTGVVVYGLGAAAAAWQRGPAAEDEPLWLAHLGWISLAAPASLLLISASPTLSVRLTAVVLALGLAVAGSGVVGYARAALGPASGLPSIDKADPQAPAENGAKRQPTPDPPPAEGGQGPAGAGEENIFEFGRE